MRTRERSAEPAEHPGTAAAEQAAATAEPPPTAPEQRLEPDEQPADEPGATPEQRKEAEEPVDRAEEAPALPEQRAEEAPALPEQRGAMPEPVERDATQRAKGWQKSAATEDRPLWAPRRPMEPPPPDEPRPTFPEAAQHRRRITTVFRLPAPADPSPASGRLLAMCAWATALGILGLAVALRGMVGILAKAVPTWYEPALIAAGLAGIVLTVGGFSSVQRPRLPWIMLALATVPLIAALGLTVDAL
ncbi:hypothetical protein [Micromonospora sp. NPDC049679]|uniref:hypothetical protein n=1 Tax=Micromonospora sp. NPDC049679 TaxID=3155920 RepID=UPI00340FCE8A